MRLNCFILTANYEDDASGHQLVFYASSNSGPVKIIITNSRPLFFVESSLENKNLGAHFDRKSVDLKSFSGSKVDALYFNSQRDLYTVKEKLQGLGVRTFESDLRPQERFLMERFINCDIEVSGESNLVDGIQEFINPQMRPSETNSEFSLLSFDIETSMTNDLYSIGYHFVSQKETRKIVHMVGESQGDSDGDYELKYFSHEKEVLIEFINIVKNLDPDFILGWHVIGFDLMFLKRKCLQYGLSFSIGRSNKDARFDERKGIGFFANIDGRVVLDGPQILKKCFYSFENFKLDTVAKEVLGFGKDIETTSKEKIAEIERRFRTDKVALAKYNMLDCTLVTDIFNKLGLIKLMVTRSKISGMLLDRVGVSTREFDHFLLPRIHRKGFVAPNVLDMNREAHSSGGHVMEPIVGMHDNVVVLDFKSLYPSIIKTFCIDPYSRIMASSSPLATPVGVEFSRTEHILPEFISELLDKRNYAKQVDDMALSQAIKILMNSFYGVMGSPSSRFYHADLPTAITGTGQWILKTGIDYLQRDEYEVIYGDTDSVFVKLKRSETSKPEVSAAKIASKLNEFLSKKIFQSFQLESFLVIEYEKHFKKFFLPNSRNSEGGAKKRYAGVLVKDGVESLHFSGMEFVRSDWTKLAKNFQYELFEMVFNDDRELGPWIQQFVKDLKSGSFDSDLVYRKRIGKPLAEYVKSTPPHIKAALKLPVDKQDNLKEIYYVYTRMGPTPVDLEQTDYDYQHYIEKQLRPIADSLIFVYGLKFDNLIGGDQLTLF